MKPLSQVSAALALLAVAACGNSGNGSTLDAGGPPSCHAETGTLACGKACLPSEEGGSCGLLLQNEQATCTHGVWVCGPIDAGASSPSHDAGNGPTCRPETGSLPCGKGCLPGEEGTGCGLIAQNQEATCTQGTWVCGPLDGGVGSAQDSGAGPTCRPETGSLPCGKACLPSEEGGGCGHIPTNEQATCTHGTWVCGPMFYCTRASDAGLDSDAGTPTNCEVQDCSLACSRTCASSAEGVTCHDVFAGEQATCTKGTWVCGAP